MDFLGTGLKLTALSVLEVALIVAVAIGINYLVRRHYASRPGLTTRMQIIQTFIALTALVVILSVLPIGDTRRGQLLSLVGILLSAAIALSSTTVLGNAMAGLMLRSIKAFKPGDFIHIGDVFGRVSKMDLFHTEIQTENRDLTTLSNVYMITHPFKVARSSGTIISVDVTLGYDVSRRRIRDLLLEAAERTELEDPFVQVGELGDFSVSYRVAGLLTDVSKLIAARSRLREMTLDALHEGGVEIVSPNFMNTRALGADVRVVPPVERVKRKEEESAAPDAVVFDKAEEAASVETEREAHKKLLDKVAELQTLIKDASAEQGEGLKKELEQATAEAEALAKLIDERQAELEDKD